MKTIGLAAIIALTSTTAFAGSFQFSVDGGTARIEFDENCTDRLCASVSWQERGSRERRQFKLPEISTKTIKKYIDDTPKPRWGSDTPDEDEDGADTAERPSKPAKNGRQARESDEPAPAPRAGRTPPRPAAAPPTPALATSSPAPADDRGGPADEADEADQRAAAPSAKSRPASEPAPAPSAGRDPAAESPRVAAVTPQSPVEPAAKPSRPTPVGEWLVEDGEGKIRIEECGANMCGYVSAAKNPNEKDRHNPDASLRNRPVIGTPILINMKPDGKRWSGRIYNVKDGRSYTAHISLKSADTLRVEGCAFGGMICGGQNWSRAN